MIVRVRNAIRRRVPRARLALSVRYVRGPRRINYAAGELVAICVVHNGELHVRSFLDHHFALGVKHVVMLLNDSTDETGTIASAYPNVTLLRTNQPYATYENLMKRYLAERFCKGRWSLCVDIDELFDYPHSSDVPLHALLGYLNARGDTAVVCQLLDMFADGPLNAIRSQPEDRLRDTYSFFDITAIRKIDYRWSRLTNQDVKMHHGGIRSQAFGTDNGLTKAALVRVLPGVEMFVEWHHCNGAVISDFTAVLLHYPFVETFRGKVADAVATGRYGYLTTDEYHAYWASVQDDGVVLKRSTARRLGDLTDLLNDDFLVAGPNYTAWVSEQLPLAGDDFPQHR